MGKGLPIVLICKKLSSKNDGGEGCRTGSSFLRFFVEKYLFKEETPTVTRKEHTPENSREKPETEEAERIETTGKSTEPDKQIQAKKAEEQRGKEIEKARQDDDDARKSEAYYRTRYRNINTERTRYLWKENQRRVEETTRRLEELEHVQ